MANVYISLNGSDAAGDGTIQNPYRTFTHAFAIEKDNNRFIFVKDVEDATAVFEEEPISLETSSNVTLHADIFGEVLIQTESISITNSNNISFSNLLIEHDDGTSATSFIEAVESSVKFYNSSVQNLETTGIDCYNTNLVANGLTLHGALGTILLLNLTGVSKVTSVGGIYFKGEYNKGLNISGSVSKVDIDTLEFSGIFYNAGDILFGSVVPPVIALSKVKIDGSTSNRPNGLSIVGAINSEEYIYINRYLAHNCNIALEFIESSIEVIKATLHNNTIGLRAADGSLISLKNSILTENTIALSSESNSNIDFSFSNLYGNDTDYLDEYVAIDPPEEISLFGTITYNLLYGNIDNGSERVVGSSGELYRKDIDYIITYGSDFVVGTIRRISAAVQGDIPDGQKVKIYYKYKNPAAITGSITPGQRVRRVDPQYRNKFEFDFNLKDASPLIDSGTYVGFSFLGIAPDMGYNERTKLLSPEEAKTQLSLKSKRNLVLLEPDVANTIALQIDNVKAYNDNIDVSEGSAIRDLLINPAGHLIDTVKAERDYLMSQQSILNYAQLTNDEMDMLAGNYFITRKNGEAATGSIRLYFNSPVNVTVPAGTTFNGGGAYFIVTRSQYFIADVMVFNIENGVYYADVSVQAETFGSNSNVAADTVRSSDNFTHPNLVDITNPFPIEGGLDTETNLELYDRLSLAWTIRAFTSPRSITTILTDAFNSIKDITTVGARDPKMMRDVIPELTPYVGDYHTYGRVDVYVSMESYIETSAIFELDEDAQVTIDKYNTLYMPIIYIKKIELLDLGESPIREINRVEYELIPKDPNYRFSVEEVLTWKAINPEDYANLKIRVTYVTTPHIDTIQEYVNSDEVRNICTDILVKHYVPKITSVYVDYTPAEGISGIEEDVQLSITAHLEDQPPGETYSLSKLAVPILNTGAQSYLSPITVSVETWNIDGTTSTISTDSEIFVDRDEKILPGDVTVAEISS